MRSLWDSWNAFMALGIFTNLMGAFATGFFVPIGQECTARQIGIGFVGALITFMGLTIVTMFASLIWDEFRGLD